MSKPWPYRFLLCMLPPGFRARHRVAIDEALASAWNEAGSGAPAWRFWLRASFDLLTGVVPAWLGTLRTMIPTRRSHRHGAEDPAMDGWLQDIRYGARGYSGYENPTKLLAPGWSQMHVDQLRRLAYR